MQLNCVCEELENGIRFSSIVDKRLKTNTVGIHLTTKLNKNTSAKYAIIPLLLSDSNKDYPSFTELNKKLSSLYGTAIRGGISKRGDSQIISLVGSCIDDEFALENEKVTSEMLSILINCLINPNIKYNAFIQKDFDNKKQELLDDIYAEINDKRSYAMKRAAMNIFENEPAAESVKGEPSDVDKLTPSEVYSAYINLLKTSQIEIIYVGKMDPEFVKAKIYQMVSKMSRNYEGKNFSTLSKPKSELRNIEEYFDVEQTKMVMAFKTNSTDKVTIKLFNALFGGTPFSKLFLNVREKLSLCYYCSSGYYEAKGVLYIDSGVEKNNIEPAKQEILNQLEKMKCGDFTEQNIEESRLAIIDSWRGVNDNPRALASWYLNERYYNTNISPEELIEKLKAVTKDDIVNVANSFKLDTIYVLTKKG